MARWVNLDDCVEISVGEMNFYPVELLGDVYEEVAPVIHAHWKRNFQRQGVYKDLWLYCSNCNGRTSEEYAPYWWLYCPYCGAKMDEEADNGG